MNALLGKKIEQSQRFLEDGTRVPVTAIAVQGNPVVGIRTVEKNGYSAVQIGFGTAKNPSKPLAGLSKKANLSTTPYVLREVKVAADALPEVGTAITAIDVFKPGDIIQVTGVSKGKGWAGGVKRHHFKGGPRTHGQSDRERAPGSIGQTTTPGRVYKGKRMAGRMGAEQVTVKNLTVVDVNDTTLLIAGLVPGPANNILLVTKIGEKKNFVPLYKIAQPEPETPEKEQEPNTTETPQEAKTEQAADQPAQTTETQEPAKEGTLVEATEQETVADEKNVDEAEVEPTNTNDKEDKENGK